MAKKIDMLRSGLPSKMYYLGYKQPMSIYEMSKEIYGKVQPQKLYAWRDKLRDKGYLKEVSKNKWQSTSTPLLEEIQKRLKDKGIMKLSQDQKNFLINFLDIPFRKTVMFYESDINNITDAVEFLITDLDLFLILYENTTYRKHPEWKLHLRTINDYKQTLAQLDKQPDIIEKMQKESFDMTKKRYGYGTKVSKEYLPLLLIPYEIIILLKGISLVGKKYIKFTNDLNELNSLASGLVINKKGFRKKPIRGNGSRG